MLKVCCGWWTFSDKPESTRYYSEGDQMFDYKIPGVWKWIGKVLPDDSNKQADDNH
jgi:hypothetical protein